MPAFFDDIANYGSVSFVGTAKNAGKTFCLRRVLEYYKNRGTGIAVTSIGVDGENTDALYKNPKPELVFYPGMLVQTSETHYRQRHLTSSIVALGKTETALGRLVTARVEIKGRLIISGPAHTLGLKAFIEQAHSFGNKTVLIDGALSRMSPASTAVANAMILCTGASLSKSIDKVVEDAVFRHALMQLPTVGESMDDGWPAKVDGSELEKIENGVWGISACGLHNLGIRSTLLTSNYMEVFSENALNERPSILFVSGLVSDKFLLFLTKQRPKTVLIVVDFTKLFVMPRTYRLFLRGGGKIFVLRKTHLLAVCANPVSPDGYAFDSKTLCQRLSEALSLEVFDLARE